MPFAVHLTSANLAAVDAGTPIDRTQIVQGDSLKLSIGQVVEAGIHQLEMFQEAPVPRAETVYGEMYDVSLERVDTILMNPPFTKVERGISKFVDMDRFRGRCGGEVGLWGHFIALADVFLRDEGCFGGVIPINVLRGKESEKVRHILFREWAPLYVLKATRNYGFSEWAEYRDVLFVAQKRRPDAGHEVKFCLVKKDVSQLDRDEALSIAGLVKRHRTL